MIISIASGKGGTGKTTVAVNLAISLGNTQLVDCDVEEPDAHIFLKPKIEEEIYVHVPIPVVDETKCAEVCEFNAIAVVKDRVMVFQELCHGCGGCALFCPKNAIIEKEKEMGIIRKGSSKGLEYVEGILNIGEPMPTPLLRKLKKQINQNKTVIIDVSPGVSCPVIESIYGSDFCILVTEPTPFGLFDLTLTVAVLQKMKIPFGIIINRDGIGDEKVEKYCRNEEIPILMRIPMDREIAELYSEGIPFGEKMPEWKDKFVQLYQTIVSRIDVMGEKESCAQL